MYLSALLYLCMVAAGVSVHYLFVALDAVPQTRPTLQETVSFAIDHTFFLNLAFGAVVGLLYWTGLTSEPADEKPSTAA